MGKWYTVIVKIANHQSYIVPTLHCSKLEQSDALSHVSLLDLYEMALIKLDREEALQK